MLQRRDAAAQPDARDVQAAMAERGVGRARPAYQARQLHRCLEGGVDVQREQVRALDPGLRDAEDGGPGYPVRRKARVAYAARADGDDGPPRRGLREPEHGAERKEDDRDPAGEPCLAPGLDAADPAERDGRATEREERAACEQTEHLQGRSGEGNLGPGRGTAMQSAASRHVPSPVGKYGAHAMRFLPGRSYGVRPGGFDTRRLARLVKLSSRKSQKEPGARLRQPALAPLVGLHVAEALAVAAADAEVELGHVLVRAQCLGLSVHDDAPGLEDVAVGGVLERHVGVLLAEQYGQALLGVEALHDLEDLLHQLRGEA